MIQYDHSLQYFLCRVFQKTGSVFPNSLFVALPCALLTAAVRTGTNAGYFGSLEHEDSVLKDNAAWGGFSFLVGFLIVFRTSQSYSRFWEGCTSTCRMGAEWFDGCSSLIAFCKNSKADENLVRDFQNTLVRLFSMLHSSALADIEDEGPCNEHNEAKNAFKYELLDVEGVDEESLTVLRNSNQKVELIFQWIQQLVCEGITTGVLAIPPPILSRAFQENANGMVEFHEALKISSIPFPFPYTQSCDFLLLLHWLVTPFVVSQWVSEPFWAAIFSFTQVFILWALNFIAVEIEHPFGTDANDINGQDLQMEMNAKLLLLLHPDTRRTPRLSSNFQDLRYQKANQAKGNMLVRTKSFADVWSEPRSSRSSERTSVSEGLLSPRQIPLGHEDTASRVAEIPQLHPDLIQLQANRFCTPKPDIQMSRLPLPLPQGTDAHSPESFGQREDAEHLARCEYERTLQPSPLAPSSATSHYDGLGMGPMHHPSGGRTSAKE